MKQYDLYGSICWIFLAIFLIIMAIKFGLGTLAYPSIGFFPFLVGVILFFLSLGLLFQALKQKGKDVHFTERPHFAQNNFLTLAILFVYCFSLEYCGYVIGSFFLMLYLFKITGSQRWWFSTLVAGATVAATYYVFKVLLQAQFPDGVLNIG